MRYGTEYKSFYFEGTYLLWGLYASIASNDSEGNTTAENGWKAQNRKS